VEERERGHALGARLLSHGRGEAQKLGFGKVYLSTDHVGYYEKYGWAYIGQGYGPFGTSRIYETVAAPAQKC
jgi:N-acetylglutamate synthase-like GNAT family acetyltransferase